MKLDKLVFEDFRQFKGRQTVKFSTDKRNNVTLIFGNNGSGKTTILSAIEWVLYEEVPADFEHPDQLLHNDVFSSLREGQNAETTVELHLEDKGNRYTIRRTASVCKVNGRQTIKIVDVRMDKIDRFGNNSLIPAPDNLIRSMFPPNLSKFFFFNGERLSDNAAHGFHQLGEEIRFIMGLVKYERAIKRLPKVQEKLTIELAELSSDDKSTDLKRKLEDAYNAVSELSEKSERLSELIRWSTEEHNALQESLRHHAASRDLQGVREKFQQELKDKEGQLREEKKQLAKLVNDRAAVLFMREMSEQTAANAEVLRVRGELPRAVKTQFIDDLLHGGACICGTLLNEGSEPYEKVKEWRQKAGHAETEEAWILVAGRAGQVNGDEQKFAESYRTALDRIKTLNSDIDRLENQISAVDNKLKNVPVDEVKELEGKVQARLSEISSYAGQKALCDDQLQKAEESVEFLSREIGKISGEKEAAEKIKRMISTVDNAIELLKAEYAIRLESIRSELESSVNETYGDIINHDYKVHVSSEFVVTLTQMVNGHELPAARSTAETYALYLAYIAQLSKLNNELARFSKSGDEAFGERVPIVMDASFGDFDYGPARELAAALPDLSHQIVVLVSKRQGKGLVEDELEERCGRKTVLTMHVVKGSKKDTFESEKIEVDGMSYDYVVESSSSDFTSIVEVR